MTRYLRVFLLSVLSLTACNIPQEHSETANAGAWTDMLTSEAAADWVSVGSNILNPQWRIDNGELSLTQAGGGDITTGVIYQNFELRLEWKISKGGNSGIFYLANPDTDKTPVWASALEMQILDDVNHADNKTALTRAGSVYALYPAKAGTAKPYDEWNTARIRVNNGQVEHWLNGEKVTEFNIRSNDFKDRVARSKFNDYADVFAQSPRGLIVLQDHQDPVSFRHIQIRELK